MVGELSDFRVLRGHSGATSKLDRVGLNHCAGSREDIMSGHAY